MLRKNFSFLITSFNLNITSLLNSLLTVYTIITNSFVKSVQTNRYNYKIWDLIFFWSTVYDKEYIIICSLAMQNYYIRNTKTTNNVQELLKQVHQINNSTILLFRNTAQLQTTHDLIIIYFWRILIERDHYYFKIPHGI